MSRPAPPPRPRKKKGGAAPPFGGKAPPPSVGPGSGILPDLVSGRINRPQRIVLYGVPKIGKTTLASLLPGNVFLDLEDGSANLDLPRFPCHNYDHVRRRLSSDVFSPFKCVTIDSGTALIPFTEQHVLATRKTEKGVRCDSIEDYGWGKGYKHVHDEFKLVLTDLDQHIRAGRHVCIILHADATNSPNPDGPDWLRWEPALQKHSIGNIRNLVTQWADHLLFMGYDINVSKDGKANESGQVRTLYPSETPTLLAGSRRLRDPIPITEGDASIWEGILNAQT